MTEIRATKVYKDGVLVGEEDIHEVSDEQLYQEQIAKDSNDNIHAIKDAYDNWDSLSSKEKAKTLNRLLVCMLNLYKGQY